MIHVHSQFPLESTNSEEVKATALLSTPSSTTHQALEPGEGESRLSFRARLLQMAFIQASNESENTGDEDEDESVFRFFDFLNQQEESLFHDGREQASSQDEIDPSSIDSNEGNTSSDGTSHGDDASEADHSNGEAYFFSVADSDSIETGSDAGGDVF